MITYLKGDATRPQGDGHKTIAHVCNDRGGWGAGFVLAISRRWKAPEGAYRKWHRGSGKPLPEFKLGLIQIVQVENDIAVANMLAQKGYRRQGNGIPLQYDALKSCLQHLFKWAKDNESTVHMPRIGCGLAGGKWSEVEAIIKDVQQEHDVPVFVYDL